MTRDLCTFGSKANFTVYTKLYEWESECSFHLFPDDSLEVDVMGKIIQVSLYALKVHVSIINLISILKISLVCLSSRRYVINH
jgi:hypothetical protein